MLGDGEGAIAIATPKAALGHPQTENLATTEEPFGENRSQGRSHCLKELARKTNATIRLPLQERLLAFGDRYSESV
ncbi:MAG: hypothetical protein LRZ84_24875 [Desertifilum sp.]|nr:hypothetical protein [Desertifilum sp.]MDI9639038.1 hypothetical protein [Geitlerinema splendidum]